MLVQLTVISQLIFGVQSTLQPPQGEALRKWVLSKGGKSAVQIRDAGPMGNGVFASRDVIEGDVLIDLPKSICMNPAADREFQAANRFWGLVLMLVRERAKGEASYWHPYIETLRCGEMLLKWPQEALQLLDDPILIEEAAWDVAMNQDLQQTAPAYMSGVTDEEWRWAHGVVISHFVSPPEGGFQLCPMIDLLNYAPMPGALAVFRGRNSHRKPDVSRYHAWEGKRVRLRADRAVAAGEQVFEDFGVRGFAGMTAVTLREHGFIMENDFDCYRTRLASLPLDSARRFLEDMHNTMPACENIQLEPVVCLEPGVMHYNVVYHLWMSMWTEEEASSCAAVFSRSKKDNGICPRRLCFKDERFTLAAAKTELRRQLQPPPSEGEMKQKAEGLSATPRIRSLVLAAASKRRKAWNAIAETWGFEMMDHEREVNRTCSQQDSQGLLL